MKHRIALLALLTLVCSYQVEATERPTAEAVEGWADALFAKALDGKRMSGAVLTMVQDGEIVLSKGYGYADYAAGTTVDSDDTRFRIGSTTKTFTALAIAQLMDDGRIASLDDPANKYLTRLQLPSPDGVDITLKHLLTHSAGFENKVYRIGADRKYELPLSEEEIARYEPSIVSPPGKYSSYNNYGTTVLGLIVEDVSGETIAEYFDRHIFAPLGMTKSILNMSTKPSEGLGTPYAFLPNGEPVAIPHRTVHPFYAPVGGINATGNDMARYMIAQLAQGTDENPILSQEMFRKMHTQIRSNHELSSGFGMIYFTWDWNGTSLVVHGGDWPGTHSGMMLFPDSGTGVFFSLMAEYPEVPILESILGSERLAPIDGVTVDTPITNLGVLFNFVETFFGTYRGPEAESTVLDDLSEYEGSYVARSAAFSTMERMLSFGNPFSVVNVTVAEGGLMFNGAGPYAPAGSDVFRIDDYSTPLDGLFLDSPIFSFTRDESGAIDYLVPQIGFDVWVKSGTFDNPQTYASAWALLFLVCLTGVVSAFYPRIAGRPWAKWLPMIVLTGLIAMPLIIMLGYGEGEVILDSLFFGDSYRFVAFTVMANIVAVSAVALAWHVVVAWRESFWSGRKLGGLLRVHYSILGLAALLFIPVFAFLHLIAV